MVGFKPSYGTVSNHGTLDPWPTLDHTGVFARNVADAALLAATIAEGGALSASVATPAHPPRLAIVRSPVWHLAETAQKEMLALNAKTLRDAGADVRELELPAEYDDAHRVQRMIMAYEGARHFAPLQKRSRESMSAQFNALLDEGAAIAEAQYREALARTRELRADFSRVIDGYDAIITPPAAGEAPATLEQTGNPAVLHDLDAARRARDHDTRRFRSARIAARPADRGPFARGRSNTRRCGVVRIASAFSRIAVSYFAQLFNLMVEVMLPLTLLVAAGALWPRFSRTPRSSSRARC